MRIGRPFSLDYIQNAGEVFVVLWTKCRVCGKQFRITVPDDYALELAGSRSLACIEHQASWIDAMEDLGVDGRVADQAVVRTTIILGSGTL